MDRRKFLKLSAGAGALALMQMTGISCIEPTVIQASLPYKADALAPYICEKTILLHYQKHHAGYVNNLNHLIKGTPLAHLSLEELICKTRGKADKIGVFNNAGQVFNHTFYWSSMKPGGGGVPEGLIGQKITADFGSYHAFKNKFAATALSQFGSGWVWLVKDKDKLKIIKTSNAETPVGQGLTPLLVIDVWEHAYYLDYQNKRADYINAYLEHLVNWEFAQSNLAG